MVTAASHWSRFRRGARDRRVGAGEDVAAVVERHVIAQPLGVRIGTDEHKQRTRRQRSALRGLGVLHDHRVEGFLADQLAHLAVREHLDGRVTDDPVGQVARHVLAQLGFADDERQSRHVPRQEQRRLTG